MACTLNQDEIKSVKGLGFLNNKGTNRFNGRIITTNGKITAEQTACIDVYKRQLPFGSDCSWCGAPVYRPVYQSNLIQKTASLFVIPSESPRDG